MSVGRVARHFEGLGKVPVDIKDVLEQVKNICPDEKIKIRGVNVDPDRLKGNCYKYRINDSKFEESAIMPIPVSMIIYSTRMHPHMQRLVCCKELVHLMDPDPFFTTKREEVLHLAENVPKPMVAVANPAHNDLQVFLDQLAKWQALAILFPFGLWEELMPKFKEGKVTIDTIVEWVELPKDFVTTIMSDQWAVTRSLIISN